MISISTRAAVLAATALTSVTAVITAGAIALAPTDSKHPDAAQERPAASALTMSVPSAASRSSAEALSVEAAAAGWAGNETTTFVPLVPCRIADTRKAGGALTTGKARNFAVAGTTGFAAQGGKSGGCGIPENAVAVAAILRSSAPPAAGYLKAWARGTSIPATIALNFLKGQTIGDGTVVPLGDPYTAPGMSLRTYNSKTHVVIEATGYYVLDDHGLVNSDGTLWDAGATAWDVTRDSVGEYTITVDHDIYHCVYLATPEYYGTIASTTWDNDFNNVFHVSLQDLDGNSVDAVFYYDVEC